MAVGLSEFKPVRIIITGCHIWDKLSLAGSAYYSFAGDEVNVILGSVAWALNKKKVGGKRIENVWKENKQRRGR